MSDLHDEITMWRLHLAEERPSDNNVCSPENNTMPYIGEFIGE
jgi:hypothetical protein